MASDPSGGKAPSGHDDPTAGLDADPNVTFAAVGRAISDWEILEIHLALLYSIVTAKTKGAEITRTRHTNVVKSFGKVGRITEGRIKLLRKAAEAYFVHHCDQGIEARFDELLSEVRMLADKRHQIAHGVVGRFPAYSPEYPKAKGFPPTIEMYAVILPIYVVLRLNKGAPYRYNAAQINKIASEFWDCGVKVQDFYEFLEKRP